MQKFALYILMSLLFQWTLSPSKAQAGLRPWSWVWDVETLRAGEVELEQWLWVKREASKQAGWIWFSPVLGLTNQLELAFPWETVGTSTGNNLASIAVELRYAWFDPLDEDRLFRVLNRAFVQQNFNEPRDGRNAAFGPSMWLGGNLVMSYGPMKGQRLVLDLGYTYGEPLGGQQFEFATTSVGYVYPWSEQISFGFEFFKEDGLPGAKENLDNTMAGPNFLFQSRRFWLTLGLLNGLRKQDTDFMPRLMFGVML